MNRVSAERFDMQLGEGGAAHFNAAISNLRINLTLRQHLGLLGSFDINVSAAHVTVFIPQPHEIGADVEDDIFNTIPI